MRATALLSISAAAALSCGKAENVALTARLVMSSVPGDWCGSNNPDTIRLDCPFELGLYVLDASSDAGTVVLKTTCVKMAADPMRQWKHLPMDLSSAMASLERIQQGPVRVELAAVEPEAGKSCEYQSSVANASLYGRSRVLDLSDTEMPKRFDISTKCLKPFTPTMTCIP